MNSETLNDIKLQSYINLFMKYKCNCGKFSKKLGFCYEHFDKNKIDVIRDQAKEFMKSCDFSERLIYSQNLINIQTSIKFKIDELNNTLNDNLSKINRRYLKQYIFAEQIATKFKDYLNYKHLKFDYEIILKYYDIITKKHISNSKSNICISDEEITQRAKEYYCKEKNIEYMHDLSNNHENTISLKYKLLHIDLYVISNDLHFILASDKLSNIEKFIKNSKTIGITNNNDDILSARVAALKSFRNK